MKKQHNCGTTYPLAIQLLKPPDTLNDGQEIDARNWDDWATVGYFYGRCRSGSAREVIAANQTHGQTDAVFWAPWNSVTRSITERNAIKVNGSWYNIRGAINVDELNVEMMLLCTKGPQKWHGE